jgi:hypothetical protein
MRAHARTRVRTGVPTLSACRSQTYMAWFLGSFFRSSSSSFFCSVRSRPPIALGSALDDCDIAARLPCSTAGQLHESPEQEQDHKPSWRKRACALCVGKHMDLHGPCKLFVDGMDDSGKGPEQVIHLTAPGEAALLACLEALLPPAFDARTLIDIGAVYVDRERCVSVLDSEGRRVCSVHTCVPTRRATRLQSYICTRYRA